MRKELLIFFILLPLSTASQAQEWKTNRHENALAAVDGQLILLGGRGLKPVESFDPQAMNWETLAETPLEMHHFQAVTYKDEVWVLGAFTGKYPHETPIPDIYIFNPKDNEWRKGPQIPADRRRGAAGVLYTMKRSTSSVAFKMDIGMGM